MKYVLVRVRAIAVRLYRRTCGARAQSRISRVVKVANRSDLPKDLDPRCIYLLGSTTPKWALLDCPCGRGHTIELNLANPERVRWKVTTNKASKPSVFPSIDYQGRPRCHYWLQEGRVHWIPTPQGRPQWGAAEAQDVPGAET